jgi:hypothetical protein
MLAAHAAFEHATDQHDRTWDEDTQRVTTKFRESMEALGMDLTDPNLSGTELRVARGLDFRRRVAAAWGGMR